MTTAFAYLLMADPYAQRRDWEETPWLDALLQRAWQRMPGRALVLRARRELFVRRVARAGQALRGLDDRALHNRLMHVRARLRSEGFTDGAAAQAFALVRVYSQRELGVTHFDSQVRGAWTLLGSRVAEMATGEGKTLTATLAAATAALAGLPVHVVTVNDYLARRDFDKLTPLYRALGLTTGLVCEDSAPAARAAAYRRDVVYCSNKTVVFDYLRDRSKLGARMKPLAMALDAMVHGPVGVTTLRGLHYAIVDEADSVFVDEARTPLILSATVGGSAAEAYWRDAVQLARALELPTHARQLPDGSRIELTDAGRERLAELARAMPPIWHAALRRAEAVEQALVALHVFHRDVHYIVRDGKVQIVDANTGRVMADRSWERGLHQMIEIKEGVAVTGERETLARISYQLFFRRYMRVAGMTGTCREVAGELAQVYGLQTLAVPTRLPSRRVRLRSRMYGTAAQKWQAVAASVRERVARGQPVLVGTRSIRASEELSAVLAVAGIVHQVLNAKQDADEAALVERAGEPGRVTIATSMAGRGTDIGLGEAARAAGGLHVILTERHDNARVDRQLVGRGARQGDPGTWQAILSMEDDIMTERHVRGAAWLRAVLTRWPDTAPARWLALACHRMAQRRLERDHAAMRGALLKADFQSRGSLSFSGQME